MEELIEAMFAYEQMELSLGQNDWNVIEAGLSCFAHVGGGELCILK